MKKIPAFDGYDIPDEMNLVSHYMSGLSINDRGHYWITLETLRRLNWTTLSQNNRDLERSAVFWPSERKERKYTLHHESGFSLKT